MLFRIWIRLEERGWVVSGGAHSSSSSSGSSRDGGGGKGNASFVVVKTGKKKMDHERYLDATQRYVPFPSFNISSSLVYSFSCACVIIT